MVDTPPANASPHYTRTAVAMHWLFGLALLGQIAFGFLLDAIASRGTPARAGTVNLHKSFGIVLAALLVARLAWRLSHPPPVWPVTMAPWERRAARQVHRAMYVCMLLMPLSGYVASNFSRFGVRFFGFAWPPWGPEAPQVYAVFNGVHIATAYVFCALIAGHVLAALKHALVDRDTVLSRILL
jgi:cytochrome b561